MLQHEEPVPNAAQERVGADELARAIAAIEGRRQEQAKGLAGTLSIGEAVRELDLDATPDEVWAEVRAQRAQVQTPTPAASVPPAPAPPPLPQSLGNALRDAALAAAPGLKQAAQAAAPSLKQGMDAARQHLAAQNAAKSPTRRENAKQAVTAFAVVCAMVGVMAGTGVLSHLPFSHPAPVRMLATVPDNHPVSADTATVQRLEAGALPTSVSVQDGSVRDTWTLVKHNGVVYMRGYTLPLSDKELGVGDVKVYNDDNAGVLHGVEDAEVTLRLDSLKIDDTNSGQGWHEIDVSSVHPDTYTREDW